MQQDEDQPRGRLVRRPDSHYFDNMEYQNWLTVNVYCTANLSLEAQPASYKNALGLVPRIRVSADSNTTIPIYYKV